MEFKGYKVIDNALSKRELSTIIDYLAILRNNKKLKGNMDSDSAHMYYAVPYFEAMLSNFRDIVSLVVGETVYPSYSFLWNYKKNHIVPKHKDRNSVDYIISININILEEEDWDIVIDGKSIALKNGQMLILDGKKLEHWRDPCPYENRLQLILCYTRDKSLLFDKRKHLAFDPIPEVITSPFNSGLEIQDRSVLEAAYARV